MAKPKKLPSGSYRIQIFLGKGPDGKPIRKSITAATAKECKVLAAQYESEHRKPDRRTFSSAMESYIASSAAVLSPSTIRGYKSVQRKLEPLDLSRIRRIALLGPNSAQTVFGDYSWTLANAPEGITALNFDANVNGAGDIDINGLQASDAAITVNGAGDAKINGIDCDVIAVSINGAGDAKLSGRSARADLNISGAGDIDARQLDCSDINSKIRGVGSIKRP